VSDPETSQSLLHECRTALEQLAADLAPSCPPWPTRATPEPGSACTSRSRGPTCAPTPPTRNRLLIGLRAPAERANALLKSTWKALRRVTVCPQRIGHIVAAALVLLTMQRSRW